MATATLVSTPTVLNTGDSTTGWNGDTFSLEPDIKVQGSNSVSCTQTGSGANDVYVTGFSGFNLTTDKHFRLWFNISYVSYLSSTNPIQVWCSDGSNTAYWNWSGGSTYAGGWAQAIIYTGTTPTSGTKPSGTITQVGMRMNTTSKPRNVPANAWYDYWTYGDGYTVYGGTSGDPIDWSHIAAKDTDITNTAYGVVTKVGGVYFVRGNIQIGDGTHTTYFEPTGQIVVFPSEAVSSSLYGVTFVDSASGLTNVSISGGTMASESTSYRFAFDASDTNINAFTQDGTQMAKAGAIDYAAGMTIKNTVYNSCLQITPSTSTFTNNTISDTGATAGAVLLPSSTTNFNNNNFLNNTTGAAIEIPSGYGTTSTSNGDYFDSNTYDYNNLTGATHTVSKTNSANPSTYTGSLVNFVGSVSIDVNVKNQAGSNVQGALVYIDTNPQTGDTADIINATTDANGDVSTSYGGAASSAVLRIRKYGYKHFLGSISLSTDSNTNVTLVTDPQQT